MTIDPTPKTKMVRNRKLYYAILLILCIAPRFAYVIRSKSYRNPSDSEMRQAARSLAKNGTLAEIYGDGTGKSAHVSPLYPLFLAGLYKIFGTETVGEELVNESCAIIAASLCILMCPRIARRMGLSERAGWFAAFALALSPANLWIETSGEWEQPYAVLILLGTILTFRNLMDRHWRGWMGLLWGGVLLGISALLSPALVPAWFLLAAVGVGSERENRRGAIAGAMIMAMIGVLIVSPWVIRNYHALGGFVPFRSNFGLELAIGNHEHASGKTFDQSFDGHESAIFRMHPLTNAEQRARLNAMGELAFMKSMQSEAVRWMADHPTETFRLTLRRFQLYWFPDPDLWGAGSSGRRFKSVFITMIGIFSLINLVRIVVLRQRSAWLLVAAIIGTSLIYMITHVDARYRYLTLELCAILAFDAAFSLFTGTLTRPDQSPRSCQVDRVSDPG